MKYIRTKDEIWLFGETHDNGNVIIGKKQEMDFGFCFDKKDIINQANTIEELCDEFVGVCVGIIDQNFKYRKVFKSLKSAIRKKKEIKHKYDLDQETYGAIWTDKGLIFVAKMDSEGELELV